MKSRRFCVGDIHGAYLALIQVLVKSKFDYENDILICLGDVVDGWPQTKECLDELMKIKNLVLLRGNHDDWAIDAYNEVMVDGVLDSEFDSWYTQGGKETIESIGLIGIIYLGSVTENGPF